MFSRVLNPSAVTMPRSLMPRKLISSALQSCHQDAFEWTTQLIHGSRITKRPTANGPTCQRECDKGSVVQHVQPQGQHLRQRTSG
ncbi:hypothetical protein ACLKA6_010037 [Drosophila palustris]